jgi:hypothetical protein
MDVLSTELAGARVARETTIANHPSDVALDPKRGLAIIDVDEVLALFVQGFDRFLRPLGYEWRLQSFALFANIYPVGGTDPVKIEHGRALFNDFFATGCGALEPAPGAAAGLAQLAEVAQVVILTNAPEPARLLRGQWLKRHGMDYPMILSEGLKGGPVAVLAKRVQGPVIFVDDLLPNLESVADAAPRVLRFQMIADPALRALAPTKPDKHHLVTDWPQLATLGAAVFSA